MDFSKMIPEDLMFGILLWLPVASLLRFKCVCKSWLSHIESPSFISHHTLRSNSEDNQEFKLIASEYSGSVHKFLSVFDLQLPKLLNFDLDSNNNVSEVKLISCFHGIICLAHKMSLSEETENGSDEEDMDLDEVVLRISRDMISVVSILNPVTRCVRSLPPSLEKLRPDINYNRCRIHYGFGFVAETNDYRVVRVLMQLENHGEVLKSDVAVYSLNTNSWRVIDTNVPVKIGIISTTKRPSKNGVYYWLGRDLISHYPVILSFDFVHEIFGVITVGEVCDDYIKDELELAFLREKLACIHQVPRSSETKCQCNIWVWEESWVRLYTIMLEPWHYPIGFATNGKMVVKEEKRGKEGKLLLCDPVTKNFSYTQFRGAFTDLVVYKESLVSV